MFNSTTLPKVSFELFPINAIERLRSGVNQSFAAPAPRRVAI